MAITAASFSATGAKQDKKVNLDQKVFGAEANQELVAQAYRTYLANGRLAGAKTLKRGEVAGGGKKPWRQKGTGRARVGSTRVPNWRHGGVVFGPTGTENYSLNLPVKMKRQAIRQALSLQAAAGKVSIIDAFDSKDGKVKSTAALLSKLGFDGNLVLVVAQKTDLIDRATRNLAGLQTVSAKYLNVFTVMNADHLIIARPALDVLEDWLAPAKAKPAAKEAK